jgi:hypothetical protein
MCDGAHRVRDGADPPDVRNIVGRDDDAAAEFECSASTVLDISHGEV